MNMDHPRMVVRYCTQQTVPEKVQFSFYGSKPCLVVFFWGGGGGGEGSWVVFSLCCGSMQNHAKCIGSSFSSSSSAFPSYISGIHHFG